MSQVKNNASFNTVKWIAYIKVKPTHNMTLPGLCVTAVV